MREFSEQELENLRFREELRDALPTCDRCPYRSASPETGPLDETSPPASRENPQEAVAQAALSFADAARYAAQNRAHSEPQYLLHHAYIKVIAALVDAGLATRSHLMDALEEYEHYAKLPSAKQWVYSQIAFDIREEIEKRLQPSGGAQGEPAQDKPEEGSEKVEERTDVESEAKPEAGEAEPIWRGELRCDRFGAMLFLRPTDYSPVFNLEEKRCYYVEVRLEGAQ